MRPAILQEGLSSDAHNITRICSSPSCMLHDFVRLVMNIPEHVVYSQSLDRSILPYGRVVQVVISGFTNFKESFLVWHQSKDPVETKAKLVLLSVCGIRLLKRESHMCLKASSVGRLEYTDVLPSNKSLTALKEFRTITWVLSTRKQIMSDPAQATPRKY